MVILKLADMVLSRQPQKSNLSRDPDWAQNVTIGRTSYILSNQICRPIKIKRPAEFLILSFRLVPRSASNLSTLYHISVSSARRNFPQLNNPKPHSRFGNTIMGRFYLVVQNGVFLDFYIFKRCLKALELASFFLLFGTTNPLIGQR